MRSKLFLTIGIIVFIFASIFFLSSLEGDVRRAEDVILNLGSGSFVLRVADSTISRTKGLGGVKNLEQNEGMLFIFTENDFHSIWMKDMLIPIDVIWLSDGLKVVDTRENVLPISFPEIFSPRAPARYAVELSAGAIKAFKINTESSAKIFSR
jgi:uncharacterized membrane protein (UPF0127 family)